MKNTDVNAVLPAVPVIDSSNQLIQHIREVAHKRGHHFAIGVEIGFGEYDCTLNRHYRIHHSGMDPIALIRDEDARLAMLAGEEYGQLLASVAEYKFLISSQGEYWRILKGEKL